MFIFRGVDGMGLYLVAVILRFELPDFDWGDVSRGSVADRVSSYSRGSRDEGKVKLVENPWNPTPLWMFPKIVVPPNHPF